MAAPDTLEGWPRALLCGAARHAQKLLRLARRGAPVRLRRSGVVEDIPRCQPGVIVGGPRDLHRPETPVIILELEALREAVLEVDKEGKVGVRRQTQVQHPDLKCGHLVG